MKKKILAAVVCAATILSLAGCASEAEKNALANIASNAANQTSKSTSSATTSKAGTTSSTDSTSAESESAFNITDWEYNVNDYGSEITIEITGYRGEGGEVEVPSEINGIKVTTISDSAFKNNIDITSLSIPETVNLIYHGAFSKCINLYEITFKGGLSTVSFTTDLSDDPLDNFAKTPWLEAKTAENPDFLIVDDVLIKGLECKGDITIPQGVKKINNFAFSNRDDITSLTIPDSVTEIGYGAFVNCNNLKSANIPQNIIKIDDIAFFNCYNLVGTITLPDNILELSWNSFGYNGPNKYDGIQFIYRGTSYPNLKQLVWAIEQNAIDEEFDGKDFIITDNVLIKIRPNTAKIELPDTVTGIGDNIFQNWEQEALMDIIITFKGKNYDFPNLDKLKADISAN